MADQRIIEQSLSVAEEIVRLRMERAQMDARIAAKEREYASVIDGGVPSADPPGRLVRRPKLAPEEPSDAGSGVGREARMATVLEAIRRNPRATTADLARVAYGASGTREKDRIRARLAYWTRTKKIRGKPGANIEVL